MALPGASAGTTHSLLAILSGSQRPASGPARRACPPSAPHLKYAAAEREQQALCADRGIAGQDQALVPFVMLPDCEPSAARAGAGPVDGGCGPCGGA